MKNIFRSIRNGARFLLCACSRVSFNAGVVIFHSLISYPAHKIHYAGSMSIGQAIFFYLFFVGGLINADHRAK